MKNYTVLSKSVTDNLYKPKSAFINSLDAGDYSVVKPPQVVYYGKKKTKKSHDGIFYRFFFASTSQRIIFTSFDLANFLAETEDADKFSSLDDWRIDTSKSVGMLNEFTIIKQTPVLIKDKKKYPPFAFSGYEDYSKLILEKNADKRALRADLFASDILPDAKDLFYRQNILSSPIVFNVDEN